MNGTAISRNPSSLWMILLWTGLSALGLALAFILALPILWTNGDQIEQSIGQFPALLLGGAFFGLALGLAVGIAQGLALLLSRKSWQAWVLGSTLGGLTGGALALLLSGTVSPGEENVIVNLASFGLLGASLGAGQYFWSRGFVRTPLWILISGLALMIAYIIPISLAATEFVVVVLGGIIYGAVTGAGISWISRE